MYEIMSADEAIRLIRDGDCICVNSFVGIENPVALHEVVVSQNKVPVSCTKTANYYISSIMMSLCTCL